MEMESVKSGGGNQVFPVECFSREHNCSNRTWKLLLRREGGKKLHQGSQSILEWLLNKVTLMVRTTSHCVTSMDTGVEKDGREAFKITSWLPQVMTLHKTTSHYVYSGDLGSEEGSQRGGEVASSGC